MENTKACNNYTDALSCPGHECGICPWVIDADPELRSRRGALSPSPSHRKRKRHACFLIQYLLDSCQSLKSRRASLAGELDKDPALQASFMQKVAAWEAEKNRTKGARGKRTYGGCKVRRVV